VVGDQQLISAIPFGRQFVSQVQPLESAEALVAAPAAAARFQSTATGSSWGGLRRSSMVVGIAGLSIRLGDDHVRRAPGELSPTLGIGHVADIRENV